MLAHAAWSLPRTVPPLSPADTLPPDRALPLPVVVFEPEAGAPLASGTVSVGVVLTLALANAAVAVVGDGNGDAAALGSALDDGDGSRGGSVPVVYTRFLRARARTCPDCLAYSCVATVRFPAGSTSHVLRVSSMPAVLL